ncbi:MAG: hypothetical protein M5U01_30225 [Ardenticatenaceae bacterium]|nr:hypothetical protein [Ardenticatenaceae bacterium]
MLERDDGAGWGEGYILQRFGRWVLDWKRDDLRFELRAPVTRFVLQQLVTIAASVQPHENIGHVVAGGA